MGYVEESLVRGEQVVMKAKVHWAVLLWPLILFGFLWFLTGAIFRETGFAGLFYLMIFLFGVIIFGQIFAIMFSTEFAVTTKRVIAKTGVLRRHSIEIMLPKVESINVSQTLIGRIFNYGNITVTGSGGTHQSFRGIERPMELRSQVNQKIEDL